MSVVKIHEEHIHTKNKGKGIKHIMQERLFSQKLIQYWFILALGPKENRVSTISLSSFCYHTFLSINCIQIPLVSICTIFFLYCIIETLFIIQIVNFIIPMMTFKLQSIQLFIQKFLLGTPSTYGKCSTSYQCYNEQKLM